MAPLGNCGRPHEITPGASEGINPESGPLTGTIKPQHGPHWHGYIALFNALIETLPLIHRKQPALDISSTCRGEVIEPIATTAADVSRRAAGRTHLKVRPQRAVQAPAYNGAPGAAAGLPHRGRLCGVKGRARRGALCGVRFCAASTSAFRPAARRRRARAASASRTTLIFGPPPSTPSTPPPLTPPPHTHLHTRIPTHATPRSANFRDWKSYESVARAIAAALARLGADAIAMRDGADLIERLRAERVDLVRLLRGAPPARHLGRSGQRYRGGVGRGGARSTLLPLVRARAARISGRHPVDSPPPLLETTHNTASKKRYGSTPAASRARRR